jgi:GalNAc-alpha-(1->4)-GalNAc-alpha-(1->3)-diNAcBac-PP-undecaprenol alpha-1,4-N-acetyl-D-galactosaminyltransferase
MRIARRGKSAWKAVKNRSRQKTGVRGRVESDDFYWRAPSDVETFWAQVDRRHARKGRFPLRIAFAIKSLQALAGGAERVLCEVASGLAELGHDITVLTYDPPGSPSYYTLHPSIARHCIAIGDAQGPARFYETARRMLALRSRICDIRPDIVVGFMHSMFVPLGLALARTGIPLIASEHIVPDHYKTRPLQRGLLHLTPWLVARITVVSSHALAAYPARLRKHMTVVPNPVSLRALERANVAGPAQGRKTLLAVGRLAAQKDFTTLIDAFALIQHDVPDWDLRIAGEGELRGELEARIRTLHLGQRVQLPGNIKNISQEYASAQLFVMPSLYESFGLATAEAITHGLPAVGFADCPGTNVLIKPGYNGVLVEAGQNRARSLATALLPLMQDDAARRRLVPTGAASAEFATENVLEVWREMLAAVVGPAVSPPGSWLLPVPRMKKSVVAGAMGRVPVGRGADKANASASP